MFVYGYMTHLVIVNRNDDQTFSGASLGSAATRVNYQSSASEFNIVKAQTFSDKLAKR